MKKAALYIRVSTDEQAKHGFSLGEQQHDLERYAAKHNYAVVDIYADEGVTGTREDKREEFQRMMKDCLRGKIDRIYTKSISRFARNTRDCLKNIRELKSLGITMFFEKENIDTANMTDELMITVMGGLAQEESTSISQNMRWSVQKRMQNGTYRLARPPFGFDIVNGILEVNEEQAQIVKRIFEWYVSGLGTKMIADTLNEKNIPSSQKHKLWTADVVKYILKNERYTGNAVFQKNYVTETLPHVKKRNYGEKQKYYVANTNPPIIEKSVFETVQKILKERYRPYLNDGHLLSGRIFCAECGTAYRFKKCREKSYWTCRRHDIKSELCKNGRISENDIYAAFVRLYNKLMYNYRQILVPLHTELQNLKLRKFSGNTNVMDIHKEIAKLKEQNHVLARLKTKGFLDNAKYLEQTSEISAKINKLQSELKKITRSDDEDETIEELEMLIEYFEKQENPINEFEESVFEFLIEKIAVINQTELEFQIIGGLKFKEKI